MDDGWDLPVGVDGGKVVGRSRVAVVDGEGDALGEGFTEAVFEFGENGGGGVGGGVGDGVEGERHGWMS